MTSPRKSKKSIPFQQMSPLVINDVSPDDMLLEAKKQREDAQQALDKGKEEYERKETEFKRREENLKTKDHELQESVVQFNKFIKDKHEQTIKYTRLAEEERRQQKISDEQITSLEKELEVMTEHCNEVKQQFEQNKKYQTFLQKVQEEHSNEFNDIDGILQRFECLESARLSLLKRQQDGLQAVENLRDQQTEFVKNQTDINLNLNNEISQLQKELESAKSRTNDLQMEVAKKVKQQTSATRKLSEISMAVENMYHRATTFSKILKHRVADIQKYQPRNPTEAEAATTTTTTTVTASRQQPSADHSSQKTVDQISNQLEVVANYIIDYQSIVDEAKILYPEVEVV